jgi:protein-S-isoprenylcysteine O-methyltransferase Ste14
MPNAVLKWMSLAATVVLALCIIALFTLRALLAARPVGLALQGVAILLMIWARLTFGLRSFHAAANPTGGGLVTTGPYRFIRHPIYASILLFTWAAVVSHLSAFTLAIGGLACAAAAVRIVAEERLVVARYPEYLAYARKTRRLVPYVF